MRRRARFLLAGLLAVATLLSGCVSMPTSGEPRAFDIAAPETEPVEQLGFGPERDSPPERIIADFLRASAAGASDDYLTAKQYLDSARAVSWDPLGGVVIYPTDRAPQIRAESVGEREARVVVEVALLANVDNQGILLHGEETHLEIVFQVKKNAANQWRISGLADGTVLSQASFQSIYQGMQLYFLAPDQETLVPDARWYPRRRIASYLVNGLLAGPSERLAPAVYSALSSSLTLPTKGVEVDGHVAYVDMEGELPTSVRGVENTSRQLGATLMQLANVTSVKTRINGVVLPEAPDPFGERQELESSVGLSDGALLITEGGRWVTLLSAEEVGEDPRSPARGAAANPVVAWLNGDNTLSWWHLESEQPPVRVELDSPTPPSVDRWDWVWSSSGNEAGVRAFGPDGTEVALPLPLGLSDAVKQVRVSPDGVYVFLLLSEDEETAPYTAVVTRDSAGTPRSLSGLEGFGQTEGEVLSGSWAGMNSVVLLTANGDQRNVLLAAPGGFAQDLAAPPDAVRVSAGGQVSRVLLEGEDGNYYTRSGGVWRPIEEPLVQVSYAG